MDDDRSRSPLGRFRERRRAAKVRPGDGSRLEPLRWWQLTSRSLYVLEPPSGDDRAPRHEIDVRRTPEATYVAALYRDGVQTAHAKLPARFTVPGGVVEVATSQYGLKRMHHVDDAGHERPLRPHPRSREGLRARFDGRFPRTSRGVAAVSLVVLAVGAAVGLMEAVEAVTHAPPVAEAVGAFTSPVGLGPWGTVAVGLAVATAATERALRLRHTWLADVA